MTDRIELCNPTIEQLEPGMMVRCSPKNWGIMISEVNLDTKEVLVGDCIGGRKESWTWTPVNKVRLAWSIGGLEVATKLVNEFNGAFVAHVTPNEKSIS